MTYSVYLNDKLAFENLTKEEAEEKKEEMSQMIQAGLPTSYSQDDITIHHYERISNQINQKNQDRIQTLENSEAGSIRI